MTNDPEQIRAEIDQTRAELSRNVDALTETVRPGNVVRRQRDKVGSAFAGARDSVMGVAGQAQSTSGGAMQSAGGVMQSAGDAVSSAPHTARRQTQGNPLAAGLVALGAGWLLGSLLPASRAERHAADTLKEKAAPLAQEVSDMAKESAQNLQEPAKEAVAQVKSSGADAVETVKAEGADSAARVGDTAKEGAQNVKESSGSS